MADDAPPRFTDWRKSSFSSDNLCCVEVRRVGDYVQVRDTKDSERARKEGTCQTTLSFTLDQWGAFVAGIKGREFDLDSTHIS